MKNISFFVRKRGVKNFIVTVGLPVTRHPPHRSRCAELSHRAPQNYSLPHTFKTTEIATGQFSFELFVVFQFDIVSTLPKNLYS